MLGGYPDTLAGQLRREKRSLFYAKKDPDGSVIRSFWFLYHCIFKYSQGVSRVLVDDVIDRLAGAICRISMTTIPAGRIEMI